MTLTTQRSKCHQHQENFMKSLYTNELNNFYQNHNVFVYTNEQQPLTQKKINVTFVSEMHLERFSISCTCHDSIDFFVCWVGFRFVPGRKWSRVPKVLWHPSISKTKNQKFLSSLRTHIYKSQRAFEYVYTLVLVHSAINPSFISKTPGLGLFHPIMIFLISFMISIIQRLLCFL